MRNSVHSAARRLGATLKVRPVTPRPLMDGIAKLRYAAVAVHPAISSLVDRAFRFLPLERLRRTPPSRWTGRLADKTKPVLGRTLPRVPPTLVMACISALVFALVFAAGVKRGMHHVVMGGPEGEQNAISVALSDSIYGLNLGYLGHASANDPILAENNQNRKVLTDATRAAASMGPQPVGFLSDRSLITMVYDDIGYVDYAKLSFPCTPMSHKGHCATNCNDKSKWS